MVVAAKLAHHWSPPQISRWLRRRFPRRRSWHLCLETIYEGVYRGVLGTPNRQHLRTGRTYRRRRGRGRSRDGALKQCTTMKSLFGPERSLGLFQALFWPAAAGGSTPRWPKDHPETSDSRPRQYIPATGSELTPAATTRAPRRWM